MRSPRPRGRRRACRRRGRTARSPSVSASQQPTARASSVSAVTAPQTPSSCSAPRAFENDCSGWRPKRRTCGSSAASGVAPLTCAIHGPTGVAAATSAIARSGTHSSTSSGVGASSEDAPLCEPRAHCRADAPARADDLDALDHSLAPVPVRDTGQRKCASSRLPLGKPRFETRPNRGPLVVGDAYHALSRFSPPRTSMCLRWTPSKVAPSASSAPPRALVLRVRLELDASAAPRLERMP